MNNALLPVIIRVLTIALGSTLLVAYSASAGTNIWISTASTNASEAANWTTGVPTNTDDILLTSSSTVDMVWYAGSNGLPDKVKSWTQSESYTGTVTFPITYIPAGTAFTNFTVTSNVIIEGGIWTHSAHGTLTSQKYHLQASIGGNFTLGTSAAVNVYAKGRYTTGSACGAYGGNALSAGDSKYNAFGSLMFPTACGLGCQSGTDSGDKKSNGGGAVWLKVSGTAILDGTITAAGEIDFASGGSGGSVLIEAQNITGTGSISARGNTGTKSDGCGSSGSGGRVALIARQAVTFPAANITARGVRDAWNTRSAAGTIFLKSASIPGYFLVKNYSNADNPATTPIPASDDPVDRMYMHNMTLEAETCAHLELGRDLRMDTLAIDSTSDFDLAGFTIVLNSLTTNGVNIPTGIYAATNGLATFSALFTNSCTTAIGRVIIITPGTVMLLR